MEQPEDPQILPSAEPDLLTMTMTPAAMATSDLQTSAPTMQESAQVPNILDLQKEVAIDDINFSDEDYSKCKAIFGW